MLHLARPTSIHCFKEAADHNLETMTRDYINGGSGNELTLHANSASFDSYFIKPQIFSLTAPPNTATTLLGASVSAPIGIAPTAFHKLAHAHGEIATSLAAQSSGTIYTLSCLATTSLTTLSEIHEMGHVWPQLLTFKDRSIMRSIIKQAEKYGCGAIVVTADAPVSGNRKKDTANKFKLPEHTRMELLHEHAFLNQYEKACGSILDNFFDNYIDPFFGWDDIKAVVDSTQLPVVLKGILKAEDVQKAYEHGVQAIVVSNHGGRQLDGCVPTLVALEAIAKAVQCPIEIYMDGGVRSGADVFKALALGARAVFIGRPILWGLAARGQQGVEDVLAILKKELEHTMYLAGVSTVEEINQHMIWQGK